MLPKAFGFEGLAQESISSRSGTRFALQPVVSTRAVIFRRALGAALCALTWLSSGSRASAEVRWRSVPTHGAEFGLTSVAFDPASDRIAVGSPRGLYAGDASGVFDFVAGRSAVRDLAFLGIEGEPHVLFAATNRGVYRIAAGGRSGPTAPGPGDGARDVYRITVARRGVGVAVATAGGAFLSWDGRRWERLSPTHPTGPVDAVALREHGPAGEGLECFTLVRGALWRTVIAGPEAGGVARTWRETISFAPREIALDVVTGLPGTDVAVLFASALAVRREGTEGSRWEILRPVLPPGARIVRVAHALGRFWLATDRGLLEAPSLEGPWRRAGAPAGSATVRALTGDAKSLYVASEARLLRAEVTGKSLAGAPPRMAASPSAAEPRITDLHRAAIAHLSLSSDRMNGMQSRVRRRGWLPLVSVRGEYDRDKDWGTDFDQSFTSGRLHNLVDRVDDHSVDTGVAVTLAWNFGDVVYHPEEIDVSRELRSLLALRDDVLDELTQLYFDRERVLAQRAALAPTSVEAQQLQLRADELAAGMDAWSGGWFSRALGRSVAADTHLNSPRQRNPQLEDIQ